MNVVCSRLVLAGCAVLLLAGIANAQILKSPLAVKTTFQTVMSELDQGGDVLVVMNIEGAFQEMMDLVTKIMSAIPSDDPDAAQAKAIVSKLKVFLKKNGFFAATGVGFSSVPVGNGMSTIKLFLSRDSAAGNLPLWRTMTGGEPRTQVTVDFLPSDTALFRIVDVAPSEVLQMVKGGVAEIGPAGSAMAFSNALSGASAAMGMNIENLINSMGDEMFISVKLSSQSKVVIPAPAGDKLEVPEPSLLLGCKVKNDSIVKMLTKLLAKNEIPVVESKVGSTVLVTVNGLPPMPIPFQPTFAMHGGCFLVGSTPKAVGDAVSAFDQKNGFAAGAEFKKAFKDLSAVNNGMAFLSPRVFETIAAIQAGLMKSGGRSSPDSDLFQSMFSDMLIAVGK
ncbi:MAG: hypothetical protein WCN95_12540, partial [bacterium]